MFHSSLGLSEFVRHFRRDRAAYYFFSMSAALGSRQALLHLHAMSAQGELANVDVTVDHRALKDLKDTRAFKAWESLENRVESVPLKKMKDVADQAKRESDVAAREYDTFASESDQRMEWIQGTGMVYKEEDAVNLKRLQDTAKIKSQAAGKAKSNYEEACTCNRIDRLKKADEWTRSEAANGHPIAAYVQARLRAAIKAGDVALSRAIGVPAEITYEEIEKLFLSAARVGVTNALAEIALLRVATVQLPLWPELFDFADSVGVDVEELCRLDRSGAIKHFQLP